MNTYTDRHLEMQTVVSIDRSMVTGSSGFSASAPRAVIDRLRVGDQYGIETKGGFFGTICGWLIDGQWMARKSDQDIDEDHAQLLADIERRDRERLAQHRAEWIGREENLPGWLKERIHVFHKRGGEDFNRTGWGYELVVCELAALYAESGGTDTDAVNAYAAEHGTSGNQHDCAKALARHHMEGASLAGTVSALSPLTGSAFYDTPI